MDGTNKTQLDHLAKLTTSSTLLVALCKSNATEPKLLRDLLQPRGRCIKICFYFVFFFFFLVFEFLFFLLLFVSLKPSDATVLGLFPALGRAGRRKCGARPPSPLHSGFFFFFLFVCFIFCGSGSGSLGVVSRVFAERYGAGRVSVLRVTRLLSFPWGWVSPGL